MVEKPRSNRVINFALVSAIIASSFVGKPSHGHGSDLHTSPEESNPPIIEPYSEDLFIQELNATMCLQSVGSLLLLYHQPKK